MRSIADTPIHERYLMVYQRLSARSWSELCDRVRNQHDPSNAQLKLTHLGAETLNLLDQPLPRSTYPWVILYSYADIPVGTKWDTTFDPSNDFRFEPTQAVLRFGIFWDRRAQPGLAHGHHQVAVIDFPNGLPPIARITPD